jgi:hypothetical protein
MKIRAVIFFLISDIVFICNIFAQQKPINPLDGKLLLSANYAELRSMHFHSGIDLKVGGVPGAKVYAVDDAYVYCLLVSPQGYGNCVYLKHPDGNITVYGHLHKFNSTLAKFIKNEQYANKSFAFDTIFTEPVFNVKRGDIIGFAGNSGSSFGAHLHFEIRDSANVPINPVAKFYNVIDNTAPTIKSLTVFTLDNFGNAKKSRIVKDIPLKNVKGKHNIAGTIEVESPAFFGIETFDNVDETYNKTGIRKMQVSVDNTTIFSCSLDSIAFEKDRYINALQAYDLLINEKRNVLKTYVEPGNRLGRYEKLVNSGIVEIADSLTHKVSITLTDDYNNKSILNFNIKAKAKTAGNIAPVSKKHKHVTWNLGGLYSCEDLLLIVPPEALYSNTYIEVEKKDTCINGFSSVFAVNLNSAPVHKPLDFIIKTNISDSLLLNKVMLGGLHNNNFFAVNAKYNSGFVNAKISSSANYFVIVDTISPSITPKFKLDADLRKQTSIGITIKDDLSGINKYAGYIDGEWALFEYDAKNHLLTYTFDSQRITRNKKHNLTLTVSDYKNNISVLESSFVW